MSQEIIDNKSCCVERKKERENAVRKKKKMRVS
jgi:hypothetical protein